MKRRDALLGIGAGAAAMFTRMAPFQWPTVAGDATSTFEPDVEINLIAAPADISRWRLGANTSTSSK